MLRDRVRELEKTARKTPPKTLLAERARVEVAKVTLVAARELLAEYEVEYATLRRSEP